MVGHFSGAASFYARFRPGYPPELWDRLTSAAGADRTSRVLDLGSGPGTAALPLASRVGAVVAVDLDAEMVTEGRRLADAAGIGNVEWVNAAAEVVEYPDGSFRLIVIASAFHWMDRLAVAGRCRSTSSRPDQRLGAAFPAFAAELEDAVRAVEPSGRWVLDTPVQVITGRP